MGCNHSTIDDTKPGRRLPGSSVAAPRTKREIHTRIESINETCSATFGGVSVRYAYLSQRGYYPDGELLSLHILSSIS